MGKYKTLEEEVKAIMTKYPVTRDSNEKLYASYLSSHGISHSSVIEFLTNFPKYNVATFEGVTRTRRKIVENDPSLGPTEKVAIARKENQISILEYVRGND